MSLYGTRDSSDGHSEENLLVTATYSSIDTDPATMRYSSGIRLASGERYHLRARTTNVVGPDNLHLALRIDPDYVNGTSYLSDGWFEDLKDAPAEVYSPPLSLSANFLHHHSVRDIQTLHLSMNYQREVQV